MKVIIADDHPVVRQGLRQMLAVEQDLTVVGEARNGQEVVELSRRVPWPGEPVTFTSPPKSSARSCMPSRPSDFFACSSSS